MTCSERNLAISESTRLPDGETPPGNRVRAKASRSRMGPMGVLPAEAQDCGSMNRSVRRAPPVAGSGK